MCPFGPLIVEGRGVELVPRMASEPLARIHPAAGTAAAHTRRGHGRASRTRCSQPGCSKAALDSMIKEALKTVVHTAALGKTKSPKPPKTLNPIDKNGGFNASIKCVQAAQAPKHAPALYRSHGLACADFGFMGHIEEMIHNWANKPSVQDVEL